MKIVLNDVNDVEDFLKMLSPSYFRLIQKASSGMDVLSDNMDNARREDYRQRDIAGVERMRDEGKISEADADSKLAVLTAGKHCSDERPCTPCFADDGACEDKPSDNAAQVETGPNPYDSEGLPWDETIHSGAKTTKGDGTWKRLRGVSDEVYEARRAELLAERDAARAAVADDAEPVATETHALPQDDAKPYANGADDAAPEPDTAPTVDHAALIEASQEAAEDAPDGTIDLLNAGKEFIKEYGTAKFEALKSAVCPTEDGKGKAIPSMVPAERRLMRACMDNYAL